MEKGDSNIVDYLLGENRKLKEEVEDLRELVSMNKVEIDVLSKNNAKNKYIEIISNYRKANDNNLRKIELLELKIEEVVSEVPPPSRRNLCSNNCTPRPPTSCRRRRSCTRTVCANCRASSVSCSGRWLAWRRRSAATTR
jgi:hypothetical protein